MGLITSKENLLADLAKMDNRRLELYNKKQELLKIDIVKEYDKLIREYEGIGNNYAYIQRVLHENYDME